MGKIVRALSADGSALCSAVDTTDIVNEIHRIHGTSATASAAAGRLATAACIMGALMKNETDRLELRINGGGKLQRQRKMLYGQSFCRFAAQLQGQT